LQGHWIICIPAGTVHGFRFPADTRGQVLTVHESMLGNRESSLGDRIGDLLLTPQVICLQSEDVLFKQLKHYLSLIREEIRLAQNGHELMLNWLVKMVLITIKRQQELCPQPGRGPRDGREHMLLAFRRLLEQHYPEHWNVQQYASALHTSTSSLNRLCLQQVDTTAKTIIQDRLLIEIKRRLIYTREPLERIAYALGFKDPSYFSRFFKKLEGISPSLYRQDKYHETETT
jgi:AraC family transcriptional activator of pobA